MTVLQEAYVVMFLYMQVTNKAVAVGFGISTPDHIRQVKDVFPIYKDSFVLLFSSKFYSYLNYAAVAIA